MRCREDGYVCLPRTENEEAGHCEPAHRDHHAQLTRSKDELLPFVDILRHGGGSGEGREIRRMFLWSWLKQPEFNSGGGSRRGCLLVHIFKEKSHSAPKQKPGGGHEPSRTRESVENEPISVGSEANLVQRSPKEGAKREADPLSYDEVSCESCSSTNSDDAWIRAVLLRVHEEGKREAHDHTPDEDQVEEVCLVS